MPLTKTARVFRRESSPPTRDAMSGVVATLFASSYTKASDCPSSACLAGVVSDRLRRASSRSARLTRASRCLSCRHDDGIAMIFVVSPCKLEFPCRPRAAAPSDSSVRRDRHRLILLQSTHVRRRSEAGAGAGGAAVPPAPRVAAPCGPRRPQSCVVRQHRAPHSCSASVAGVKENSSSALRRSRGRPSRGDAGPGSSDGDSRLIAATW